MPQDFDAIVRRLKEVINDSKISYSELEKKTGVSKSALHRYVNGSTKKIPIDVIQAIATAVNVSAAWIMGWEEESSPGAEEKTPRERKYNEIISLLQALPEEKVTEAIRYLKYLADN